MTTTLHRLGIAVIASLVPWSERLPALLVAAAIAGAVLIAPLTMLSHAGIELVAGLIGVVAGSVYLSGLLGPQGRSVGQALLGLTVVDRATMAPLAPGRALLRGLVLVVELVTAPTLFVVVPVAELLTVHATGRSLTDRALGTAVLTGAGVFQGGATFPLNFALLGEDVVSA